MACSKLEAMSVPTSIPLKIRLNTMCMDILMVNLIKSLCFFHIIFKPGKQPDWQHLHIVKENQSQEVERELISLLTLIDMKSHVLSLWRNVRWILLCNNFPSVFMYNNTHLSSNSYTTVILLSTEWNLNNDNGAVPDDRRPR